MKISFYKEMQRMVCHLHVLVRVVLSIGKGLGYHLEIWWQQLIFKWRKACKSPILTQEENFKKQQPCIYNVFVGTDFCLLQPFIPSCVSWSLSHLCEELQKHSMWGKSFVSKTLDLQLIKHWSKACWSWLNDPRHWLRASLIWSPQWDVSDRDFPQQESVDLGEN